MNASSLFLWLKFPARWMFRGGMALFFVLTIYLCGYGMGWSTGTRLTDLKSREIFQDRTQLAANEKAPVEEVPPTKVPPVPSIEPEPLETKLARLAWGLTEGPNQQIEHSLAKVAIASMNLGDTWEAIEALDDAPRSPALTKLRGLLLLRWQRLDPDSALEYYLGSLKSVRWSSDYMSRFFGDWGRRDPLAAFEGWTRATEGDDNPSHRATSSLWPIFNQWAEQDLDQALATARELESNARGPSGNLHQTLAPRLLLPRTESIASCVRVRWGQPLNIN